MIKQVEKELGENSAALDKATEVRKTEAAEFLQTGSSVTKAAGKAIMNKARTEHKSILEAYVQQAPTNSGSYAPASGQIFGILKQMKEEFESNLAKMQEEEKTGQSDFADLKTAKSAEIAGNKKMTKDKTQALADAGDALAKAKEDL